VPESNREIVSKTFKKYVETGEINRERLTDDVEVYDHDILDGSEYRGPDGFEKWLSDWAEAWSDWDFTVTEVLDEDDTVVIIGDVKVTGRSSGIEVERQDGLVYRLTDGKIRRVDYFNNREETLAAANLSGT
jgi:ketosteroid isomerase-like protein